ncbi:MAG TPA: hypothetical protein VJQ82_03520 [Terriglobales bacterium]|nr:hypothetical protein [Terriglobales bacterium]
MSITDTLPVDPVVLQSEQLRVAVLPKDGVRIASIVDRRSGAEFLLQPHASYRRVRASEQWEAFENSACAGIVDCLPSVGSCGAEAPGGPVPDHGDFWRLEWGATRASEDSIQLQATGYSRTLSFEKRLSLCETKLEISNQICNFGQNPVPFLYAWHPLFAVDEGDRILLPEEISSARIQFSRRERLGRANSVVAWPHPDAANPTLDLSRVGSVADGTAEMLYTDRLKSGWCSIYRASIGQGLTVRFNPRQLPYLGLWLCNGGWPEDAARARQYAVAFEPTAAP